MRACKGRFSSNNSLGHLLVKWRKGPALVGNIEGVCGIRSGDGSTAFQLAEAKEIMLPTAAQTHRNGLGNRASVGAEKQAE
jgi:hypothetical protein